MKIKIAIDGNLGRKRVKELTHLGYDIVVTAGLSECDLMWMHRAWAAGAVFVVSNDSDIPRIIEREGYPMCWIDYPNDNPLYKECLVKYVHQMIKFKLKMYKRVISEAI